MNTPMNLGDLIAYLKIDDSGFQGKIPAAKQALEAVKGAAKATGQTVATTFTVGTTAASGFLVNLLKTGIGYNSLQQNSRAALKVMLGSTEAVNKQMGLLDDFARNSPFAKQVFIQAQQQMLGFGVAVEDVIPALDAIQNAIAAQGMGAPEIDRAVYALSQMKAQGKLSGETLRDLGVLGIDAATIIGEKMGKTGAEIKAMASKPGGIPVDQVWDPLINGLQDKFGGAVANVKQQWTGALDRIKGANRDIGAELARPFVDPNGGGQAVVWANTIADILRSVESQVKAAMPVVDKALSGTFGKITENLRKANAAVAGFNMQGLIRQVQTLTKYEPLLAGVGTTLFLLGLRPIPVISALAGGMWPLVAGIAALVAKSPELRGMGDAFEQGLGKAGQTIPSLVTQVLDLGMSLISALAPGLLAGAEGLGQLVGAAIKLAPVLVSIINAGVPLVGFAADLLGSLTKLPTPILASVAAFVALKAIVKTDMFLNITKGLSNFIGKAQAAANGGIGPLTQKASVMSGAMNLAKGAVNGVAGALKAAFLSNAPLLAITALVTVIGFFASQAALAKQRADSYRDALKGMVAGSDEAKESVADLAAELAATGDNIQWGFWEKMGKGADSFNEALKQSGSSAREFGDAIAGSESDFQSYIAKLESGAEASGLSITATMKLVEETRNQRQAALDGAQANSELGETTRTAAEANEDLAESLSLAAAATDKLLAAEQSLAAAKGDLKMAQYATKDAMDAVTAAIEENRDAARDANGVVDESTQAFRNFDESMIGAEKAWRTQIDAMVAAKAPQDEINAKIEEGRSQLMQQATAFFGSEEAAAAYLASLGGIPDVVSTVVELGTGAAEADLDSLYQQIVDSNPKMTIDATSSPAHATLLRQLGLVEGSEGVFGMDANADPATAKLLMTLGLVDTSEGSITMDANNQPSLDRLNEALNVTRNSKESFTLGAKDQSGSIREEALRRVRTSSATFSIFARDEASDTASRIVATINRMRATITVGAIATGTAVIASARADGGISQGGFQSFAQGGFSRLPQQAMIQAASGSGLVQWAESETGGEGFIPLAASKRARSLAIMDEIADRFGYVMVKRSDVVSRADGGVSRSSSVSAAPATTIGALYMNVDVSDVEDLVRASDALSALGVQLRMRGVSV